jgi:predicted dehydrogenase
VSSRKTLGILGAGQIVAESHLPVLKALSGIDLRWVADVDHSRAKIVASAFGLKPVHLAGASSLPEAEVVLIAIPYGARPPYIHALNARGSALYVEKPFALGLAEHDGYIAGAGPERIACGFQRRMSPAYSVLRQIIATKLLGELKGARIEFGRPGLVTGGRYSGNLAMAGGGVLFEVGVHPLDFALAVLGATDAVVERAHMERHAGFDVHTEARLLVTPLDAPAIPLDMLVSNLRFTRMTVEFDFAFGRASVQIFGDNQVTLHSRDGTLELGLTGRATAHPQTSAQFFAAFWQAFLDGIDAGTPNITSASASRVTTSALEQLYRAETSS